MRLVRVQAGEVRVLLGAGHRVASHAPRLPTPGVLWRDLLEVPHDMTLRIAF
jgi:hypothetical protein